MAVPRGTNALTQLTADLGDRAKYLQHLPAIDHTRPLLLYEDNFGYLPKRVLLGQIRASNTALWAYLVEGTKGISFHVFDHGNNFRSLYKYRDIAAKVILNAPFYHTQTVLELYGAIKHQVIRYDASIMLTFGKMERDAFILVCKRCKPVRSSPVTSTAVTPSSPVVPRTPPAPSSPPVPRVLVVALPVRHSLENLRPMASQPASSAHGGEVRKP
jgi:hypothetical protein